MKDESDARLLAGQVVLKEGAISADQLAECLEQKGELRIGDELVNRDLMERDKIEKLLQGRDACKLNLEDTVLGELAVRNGFLTREELEECLGEQEESRTATGTPPQLGEIMRSHGFVRACDIEALLSRQTALLQDIVDDEREEGSGDPSETTTEEAGTEHNEPEEQSAPVPTEDGLPSSTENGSGTDRSYQQIFKERMAGLLFPEESEPVCCPCCASSANSPLAVVCSACGAPLRIRTGAEKYNPWLLRGGFVALAALTGVFGLTEGPYVIATIMFILLGAGMLRNYAVSRRFFLATSIVLFGLVYFGMIAFNVAGDQVLEAARNPVFWWATCGGVSAGLALLTLAVAQPFGARRTVGVGGACLVLGVFLAVSSFSVSWAMAQPVPSWTALCASAAGLGFTVLIIGYTFRGGMTIETRRPGVIVEATRPFKMPDRPGKPKRNWSELPALTRPVYLTLDGLVLSGRMSAYYMVSGVLRFSNQFAYWTQLGVDLLLRSLVRAWRRLVELAKAFARAIAETVVFVRRALHRLSMVVIFPLVILVLSGLVGTALARAAVNYMTEGQLSNLGAFVGHSGILYVSCVVVVGLLARCHSPRVVIKEAFQALSFHLPNFLMLVLGTSILLSVFRWATGIGPFRFGPVSIVLGVLVIILFGVVLVKGRKSPAATDSPSGTDQQEAPAHSKADFS